MEGRELWAVQGVASSGAISSCVWSVALHPLLGRVAVARGVEVFLYENLNDLSEPLDVLRGHKGVVNAVAYDAEGALLCSGEREPHDSHLILSRDTQTH